MRRFYEARAGSVALKAKLGIHNTLAKLLTAGRSRWVSSAEVLKAIDERVVFAEATRMELRLFGAAVRSDRSALRFLGSRVDRIAGTDKIRILGVAGRGPYVAEAAEHELLHVGQLLRTPAMPDAGAVYEIIPAVVGSPVLYVVTPTVAVGGTAVIVAKATE